MLSLSLSVLLFDAVVVVVVVVVLLMDVLQKKKWLALTRCLFHSRSRTWCNTETKKIDRGIWEDSGQKQWE